MNRRAGWIGLGLMAGALFTWSPGGLTLLLIALAVAAGLWRWGPPGHRRFLVTLFVVSLACRVLLSVAFDAAACLVEGQRPGRVGPPREWSINIVDRTRAYLGMGDSDYNSERGYMLAEVWRGRIRNPPRYYHEEYGWHGYLYPIGWFYAQFDYSPVAVKWINGLLGALLGPVLFYLALWCFGATVARWAAVAVAAVPSLILWSAANLKEPTLLLATTVLFLAFVRLQRVTDWRRRGLWASAFVGAGVVLATMRSAAYPVVLIGGLALASVFAGRLPRRWRLAGLLLLLGALVAGRGQIQSVFAQAIERHIGHVTTRGVTYRYLPEAFYDDAYRKAWAQSGHVSRALLAGVGRAVWHYLGEPFPSRIDRPSVAFTYAQMVLWYALLPFAIVGMVAAARVPARRGLFLVVTTGAWTVVGALASGNVGTVFRMRDMITPYVVLLGCVGLAVVLKGRAAIQSEEEASHVDG